MGCVPSRGVTFTDPMAEHTPIHVTKAFMPPLEEYTEHLRRVWASGQLTNQGPAAVELEKLLAERLGVHACLFMANGTLAIQLAFSDLMRVPLPRGLLTNYLW